MNAAEQSEHDAHGEMRTGRFAVYRGTPYRYWDEPDSDSVIGLLPEPDGPVPDDLPESTAPRSSAVGYLVDLRRLDAMYDSQWYFEWRGEEFRLTGRRGSEVYGEVLRNFSRAFLEANGLKLYDRFEAGGWIPQDEITNLHEERTDLLAAWKAKHSE